MRIQALASQLCGMALPLGSTFLTAAENYAVDRGGKIMRIEVLSVRTALIAWYERRGCVATGPNRLFALVKKSRF